MCSPRTSRAISSYSPPAVRHLRYRALQKSTTGIMSEGEAPDVIAFDILSKRIDGGDYWGFMAWGDDGLLGMGVGDTLLVNKSGADRVSRQEFQDCGVVGCGMVEMSKVTR